MIFPRETTYLAPNATDSLRNARSFISRNTCPRNLAQIDLNHTLVDVIINLADQQIICRCNGVHILMINIIHWYPACAPSAPAVPPLISNTVPNDGSRSAAIAFLPILFNACKPIGVMGYLPCLADCNSRNELISIFLFSKHVASKVIFAL